MEYIKYKYNVNVQYILFNLVSSPKYLFKDYTQNFIWSIQIIKFENSLINIKFLV